MIGHARSSALVLGAGIQGLCTALALDRAGWEVVLLDRAPEPMLRTSLRGEGKLHLGYVYGNEPDRTTARLMVDGALSFSEHLDQWLPEKVPWAALRSDPFVYAVLAATMVSPETLAGHYRWVDEAVARGIAAGMTYAGARTFSVTARLACPGDHGYSGDVIAAYQTSEIAVDPRWLRSAFIGALRSRAIPFLAGCVIRSVARTPHGFAVTATRETGESFTRRADAVINCLWDGRLAIDATMDIPPPRPCFYRLKYAVRGRMKPATARPTTTTFALGPFGDVVCWADGSVYLSWYPVCLAGVSGGLEPPCSWRPALDHPETTAAEHDLARRSLAALAERIPALTGLQVDSVKAGVVVAWGENDIDQPQSELHQRHAIGVHDHDGYLSIDTGKFTTAPLFAAQVADRLGTTRHHRRS